MINVIILLNVIFSLKKEIQFYLKDFVETQIMYTVQNLDEYCKQKKTIEIMQVYIDHPIPCKEST